MKRLPFVAVLFAAVLLAAADKNPEKAKETAPSPSQIQQWVKQLGDESFKIREEATRNLFKAGGVAIDEVTKATKSDDAEVKQRALMIIKQIGKHLRKIVIPHFKKLGGRLTVDEKSPGKPVIGLDLRSTKITDAGLVHLKWLTTLHQLALNDTKITDAGMVHLKGLTNLQILYLRDTDVTDAGLVHLKGLANLRVLVINDTIITRAGYEKMQKALPKCGVVFQTVAENKAIAYFRKLDSSSESYVTVDRKSSGKLESKLGLRGTKITDAGLSHLKKITSLLELDLSGTEIADAGLMHLKGHANLRELDLSGTKVTDAGLVHLKGLTKLQKLNLSSTEVTDTGLVHLKELANLQELSLFNTKIADAGLVHLKRLTKLQELVLGYSKITDAGMVDLKGLTSLQVLYLQHTQVTDSGMVHLKGLANLQKLDLWNTQVTDAGLMHLQGLANLNELHLGYTKATKAGIEKLRKVLPNCKIAWHGAEDAIVEYLVKQSGKSLQIVPPPENMAGAQYKYARMYKKSKDNKAQVYALIATHVEMARELFKDNNPDHRRYGLSMIGESVLAATNILEDTKLASRMCDTFLWPNLDFAHKTHWKNISRDDIARTASWTYKKSGEDDKLIMVYKYRIAHPPHANALGWTLVNFSFFHKKRKRYQEALYYLEQIPKAEMSEQRRMWIASLKKIIKENKEKEKEKK